jgi:hypothetical protein
MLVACAFVVFAFAAGAFAAASPAIAATNGPAALTGTIEAIESDDFTIQTNGRPTGVINALTDAANNLAAQDTPYVWGGGHGEAGVASVGDIGGPGANGRNIGYDCSGAVAAVLAGAGLWPAGSFVPNDAGVIAELLDAGLIAPGPGTAPDEVTLYDRPGVHIFMNINGRFFGTSDGGAGADAKGGAGWLDDDASDARSRAFKQYHFLPAVLKDETTYGQEYTFQMSADPNLVDGFLIGDKVRVGYRAGGGSMTAGQLDWIGARTLTGTVTSFGSDGGSLVVKTGTGRTYTLDATDVQGVLDGVEPGDTVKLVYLQSGPTLTARVLTVTAVPPPPPPVPPVPPAPIAETAIGTITAFAPNLASVTVTTASGHQLTLGMGGDTAMLTGLAVGDLVELQYSQSPNGTLLATMISPFEASSTGATSSPGTPTVGSS